MEKENRRQKEEDRKKAEEEKQSGAVQELENMDLGENSEAKPKKADDSCWVPKKSNRNQKPPPLAVPKNILTRPNMVEMMTREGITPEMGAHFLTALVAESGGDIAYYSLNAGNLREQKKKKMNKMGEQIRKSYKPPEVPVVLWDEKKMMVDGVIQNRMPIAICGDERKPQHIGSFALGDGRSETIKQEVVTQTALWGVGKEGKKPGMTLWDTAAPNSG